MYVQTHIYLKWHIQFETKISFDPIELIFKYGVSLKIKVFQNMFGDQKKKTVFM